MPRHHTTIVDAALERGGEFGPRSLETAWIPAPFPFDDIVASWNVDGAPFQVELQVADAASTSPWLEIGSFGALPADRERTLEFDGGRIDVDCFKAASDRRFDRARLRFRSPGSDCRLRRFSLCFTYRTGRAGAGRESGDEPPRLPASDLAVPFKSQRDADPALRPRICSPTAVAMVLAYRGVDLDAADVAALLYDPEHDLYGNWARAVQGAWTLGVPGYLTRFHDWSEVAGLLASGQPIIASIGTTAGQLDGAPYPSTEGHLIVLRGIDREGNVLVNDPAAADAAAGRRSYRRDQLDVVWMRRGGTAYVLLPKDREAVPPGGG